MGLMQIAAIANQFVIREVDPNDHHNFMFSANLWEVRMIQSTCHVFITVSNVLGDACLPHAPRIFQISALPDRAPHVYIISRLYLRIL